MRPIFRSISLCGIVVIGLASCQSNNPLFEKLDPQDTGVHFVNQITETEQDNVLNYEYFYNGGGVAAADFNNDGLVDLYLTANQGEDKLYLNQGNLSFQDITAAAGITWHGEWKTGVTIVDINQDGWQDIYVSISGNVDRPDLRRNKLYINNQNLTFTEKAAEYGLDSPSFTTQTIFFDYDLDGDLDAYLLNHNVKDFTRFDVQAIHFMRDSLAGDKLLQNVQGKFVDVSAAAGIKGNPIGFGLGIHVADLNQDGWPDLYVSNDYYEEDYLYINNKNGTFSDQIHERTTHISYFSMGNDVGDVNNDLLPDILTTDMLPEDNKRQKLLFGPDKYEAYLSMLGHGMQPSFMRNMLQVNNGHGSFNEIGQLAGISNTDWSWSVLLADYDNDGFKDVFVSNGYLRDYTNMDFMKFYADEGRQEGIPILDVIKKMPATKTPNYIFKNQGNLTFTNEQKNWGFADPVISNGAIYADLDNDGDLEIITNNINEPAGIYRNQCREQNSGNYLQVALESAQNTGTICYVFSGELKQVQHHTPTHGFQSSGVQALHFGLGQQTQIDSLVVVWPNGKIQKQYNITANQRIKVTYAPNAASFQLPTNPQFFQEEPGVGFTHQTEPYNDFSRQILLLHMYSFPGPRMAVGDVDQDGREDFYIGGGKKQPGVLYLQKSRGRFLPSPQEAFKADELATDTDAQFIDVDQDGDLDLIVSSGGYEYLPNDLMLQKRIYLNDGKGNFTRDWEAFDDIAGADATVKALDVDQDGDLDLFVGGAAVPHQFPTVHASRWYRNEGGKFNRIDEPAFSALGQVTDAVVADFNSDGWPDLVVTTEWSGIYFFQNNQGTFTPVFPELAAMGGLWQRIHALDLDQDGDLDFVVGNYGWNTQLKASPTEPLEVHIDDFDKNGRIDPVLSYYIQGKSYPAYSRDELSDQLVALKKKYPTHESYATATMAEILQAFPNSNPEKKSVTRLESVLLVNENGSFAIKNLPIEAQFAPICAMTSFDVNGDGYLDVLVGGNQSKTRLRIGTVNANEVQIFLNDKQGNFRYHSALGVRGDVRELKMIGDLLFVSINQQPLRSFRWIK